MRPQQVLQIVVLVQVEKWYSAFCIVAYDGKGEQPFSMVGRPLYIFKYTSDLHDHVIVARRPALL